MFEPIPEALEGINVSAGVSDARFGRALSGQVMSTMKTGGQQLEIFGDLRTDEFVSTGKEFLGTTSFGHRDAILTLGGPLPGLDQTRFFLAGRHLFLRNRQPRFVTPFSVDLQAYQYSEPFPGPLVIDQTTFANNTEEQNVVQGNIVHEDGPLRIQLTGHYGVGSYTLGSDWPSRIQRFYNQRRNSEMKTTSAFLGLTGRYAFTPSTSMEVRASYGMNSSRTVDPDFGETWTLYADSVADAAIGYSSARYRWEGVGQYYTSYAFAADRQGEAPDSYARQSQSDWSATLQLEHRLNDEMVLSLGTEMDAWTMKRFSVEYISFLMNYLYGTRLNAPPRSFASSEARRWLAARTGNVDAYGYDVDGNAVDEGPDAPFHPFFASAFASHLWKTANFILETGLRYESYYVGSGTFRDPRDPRLVAYKSGMEYIPEEKIIDSEVHGFFLPRIRAQYRTAGGTEFFASAGSFAQMSSLDRVLHSYPYTLRTVSPSYRGNAFLTPIGVMIRPERCNLIEVGVSHHLSAHVRVGLSSYLKTTWNLTTFRRMVIEGTDSYSYYANDDEARMKGVEISLFADNIHGFRGGLSYALSEVRGNGAHPGSSIGYVEGQPSDGSFPGLSLLEYSQTHRGTLYLSYRGGESAGSVLQGIGLNLLMTFNFGHHRAQFEPRPELYGIVEPMMSGVGDFQLPWFPLGREVRGPLATPAIFNIDLSISKQMRIGGAELEVYAVILNVLNTKHVLNVYPLTGSSTDDGALTVWPRFQSEPGLAPLYQALNIENRWAYHQASIPWYNRELLTSGTRDIYGTPRQIRLGIRAGI